MEVREMLERRCPRCGTPAEADGETDSLAGRACAALFARGARARSGLAYAAGFAALLYLFKASVTSFAFAWLGPAGAFLGYLWSLWALAAVALGLRAAAELDRSPSLRGRAQALIGYFVGLWGALYLIYETRSWWRLFRY